MFTQKSVKQLQKQLKGFPEAADAHITKMQKKSGEDAVRSMKLLVPQPGSNPRSTGATRDSIFSFIKKDSRGITLHIVAGDGLEAPARYVEFVNDQPFFYPIIRTYMKSYRSRAKRALNKAAKEAAKIGG